MDNSKIHDTQLQNRNSSFMAFLENKKPSTVSRKLSINSLDTDIIQEPALKLLPEYSFSITGYQIGDHVEYAVTLREQYKILRRNRTKEYKFTTRYSMLEVLDEKIGGMGLPAKKWFGNRNRQFVEKRRGELEEYLNRVSKSNKSVFLRFIKQIKEVNFNKSLNEVFTIE